MTIEITLGMALFKAVEKMAEISIIEPALAKSLQPLTKWISSGFDVKKADEELRIAFESSIKKMGAPVDNYTDLNHWLQRRGLDKLLSKSQEMLRLQVAIEIIGFTNDEAEPPESLMRALEWPRSEPRKLSNLLTSLRKGLVGTSWQPMITFADDAVIKKKLSLIIDELRKWNDLVVLSDKGQALRVIVEKKGIPIEIAARIEMKYREELIQELYWHKFTGIVQVKKDTRLPLRDIYIQLGFLSLKDKDEQQALQEKMLTLDPEARIEEEEIRIENRITDVISREQHLVILGDPGSGKTFFLRYIALMLAYGDSNLIGLNKGSIPIIVRLADYAKMLETRPLISLDYFLIAYLQEHYSSSDELGDLLQLAMENGNCIFLLDGLDELSSDIESGNASHSNIVKAVEKFSDKFCNHKGNRIIVSSRIDGYWNDPLCGFSHVQISPLLPPDEVATFLIKWFTAHELAHDSNLDWSKADEIARIKVADLVPRIMSMPSIRRMAVNPLLLTILALIDENLGKLPNRRVTLYRIATQTLIESWREAQSGMPDKLLAELGDEKIIRIIAPIAFWLHANHPGGTTSISEWENKLQEILIDEGFDEDAKYLAKRFLHHARFQTGILIERSYEQFGFFHLTFEEYLAARQIARQRAEERKRMLQNHWLDPRWKEVIILAAGQLGIEETRTDDVSDYLVDLATMEPLSPKELGQPALLAGLALADIGKSTVNKKVRLWIERELRIMAQDLDVEKEKPNIHVHVSPNMRLNCADLADELGYEPDDLYEFTVLPNKQVHKFMFARYPVTNSQYGRFLKSENFSNKEFWINFPQYSMPDNNGIIKYLGDTGEEGWIWVQRQVNYCNISNHRILFPRYWESPEFGERRRNAPVIGISWWEANAYSRWLLRNWDIVEEGKKNCNKPTEIRLPNENEWLRIAKGNLNENYPWGKLNKSEEIVNYANTSENNIAKTTPVWMYKHGENITFEIMDMGGNIWEWQANQYNDNQEVFAIRGGSWNSTFEQTKLSYRYRLNRERRNYFVGFRLLGFS